jgi:hypothetical protein
MAQNVVTGAQDAAVDPYTGQAQFAEGGDVSGYSYDPATQKYSGSAPVQEETSGLGGQLSALVRNISGLGDVYSGGGSNYTYDPKTQQYTKTQPVAVATPDLAPSRDFDFATADVNRDSGGRANGGLLALAQGGISHLGDYSDGGRLLRGPGDGVSDDIPATIGKKQPARLADGEFVVPARIVSELGNGSTEAGARKLYAMMDRVQKARGKTVGKGKIATNSRASKHLPA